MQKRGPSLCIPRKWPNGAGGYRTEISLGIGPDGKRSRKSLHGPTWGGMKQKRGDFLADLAGGRAPGVPNQWAERSGST